MTKTKKLKAAPASEKILVERVQTGVRLEKRLLKVLKGLAEYHDMTLGDLLEGIVLHAFDGRHPFGDETRQRIAAKIAINVRHEKNIAGFHFIFETNARP